MKRSKIPCITIECAFGDDPFELPETLDVIRVRSNSLLWQKERLLNLAASWLPPSYRYVVWLDCDILFLDLNWAIHTMELLEEYAVVQMFEKCIRLVQGNTIGEPPDETMSFGAVSPTNLNLISCGNYEHHGHTGYGWAMRREIFDEVGLYECALTGSGDHFMAHAMFNEYGPCIEYALKRDCNQIQHLKDWGERFYARVKGNLAAVPGTILHLWHGDLVHRRYINRMHTLVDLGFNPYQDVVAPPGAPLRWYPLMQKQVLRNYFIEYFRSRREDG